MRDISINLLSSLCSLQTEQLAANLQQWLQSETEDGDEAADDEEESVFNTITSSMGNALTKKMRDGIECEFVAWATPLLRR